MAAGAGGGPEVWGGGWDIPAPHRPPPHPSTGPGPGQEPREGFYLSRDGFDRAPGNSSCSLSLSLDVTSSNSRKSRRQRGIATPRRDHSSPGAFQEPQALDRTQAGSAPASQPGLELRLGWGRSQPPLEDPRVSGWEARSLQDPFCEWFGSTESLIDCLIDCLVG